MGLLLRPLGGLRQLLQGGVGRVPQLVCPGVHEAVRGLHQLVERPPGTGVGEFCVVGTGGGGDSCGVGWQRISHLKIEICRFA